MTDAYEQFLKWKDSGLGRKFEDAILAQEREQQIRKYQEQFKNKDAGRKRREQRKKQEMGKQDEDPEIDAAHKELAMVDAFGCPTSGQRERLAFGAGGEQPQPSQGADSQQAFGSQSRRKDKTGKSQPSNVLDNFRSMTTQLPLHGHKVNLLQDGKDLKDQKGGEEGGNSQRPIGGTQTQRRRGKNRGEKFAGMLNDTVWKYNPNSYYNADNDKNGQKNAEHYQDQRAFFLHRKHLAEAIEKARKEDPLTAKQKADAEEAERLAAERRQQNKKAYNDMKRK